MSKLISNDPVFWINAMRESYGGEDSTIDSVLAKGFCGRLQCNIAGSCENCLGDTDNLPDEFSKTRALVFQEMLKRETKNDK